MNLLRNYKLTVAYDGSRYRGWQRLPDTENTIQGKLEGVLTRLSGKRVEISGSGRTDAGAHAMGQVASFHMDTERSCQEILDDLRHYLPEDIGAISLEEAPPRFHARLNARRKTYRYRIWNSDLPCVFQRRYVYVLPEPLDITKMREGAARLIGTRDFLPFCSNKHYKKTTVRTVEQIDICQAGEEVSLTFTGDGFLYNMVRIMTGTLIEIGLGKREPESIDGIFAGKRRELAGYTVPAKGLCLMEVEY